MRHPPGQAAETVSAISRTDICSVSWLNTRNSPGSAGRSDASRMHWTVSTMLMIPRVWPPWPYTVRGWSRTAWMVNRLRTVPKIPS